MKRLFIFVVVVLVSCAPASTQTKSSRKRGKRDENPQPAWLSSKPDDGLYYNGIGHATKGGQNNYIQEAKKSALEDLVSEIKVNVSSTSVLNQLDDGKGFSQKYQQMIQTTATDDIQDFEQVDVWQDDQNYWVYYRLSKQRYHDIKEQQKKDAVALGLDFFTKARQSEQNDPVTALGFYYQGFRAIEKYLAEPLRIQYQGTDLLLTNEIISDMQLLLDKMQLSVSPSQLMINRIVAQSGQTVTAKVVDKASQKPITGLPLIAAFEKGAGDVFPNYKTDESGSAKILLTQISSRDLEQTMAVKVNLLKFAGDNPSDIYSLVSQKINAPKAVVVMNVQRPLVFLSSAEKNLGVDKASQQVAIKIKNYLATAGFEFTNDKSKAELSLDVNSYSEKGAVSGSIYITYATSVIRVTTVKDNTEIYATTLDRVKGFSLDYERSSQDAYAKLLGSLDSTTLPEMLNAILQ